MARPYNYAWQSKITVRIRLRAGGAFRELGPRRKKYIGGAHCEKCGYKDHMPIRRTKAGMRPCSELHVAHLVIQAGEPAHDADENLALLCEKCHKAHDKPSWAPKLAMFFLAQAEQRIDVKDSRRPILRLVQGG